MAGPPRRLLEPVSTTWGIKVIVTAILSLFGSLFGRGVDKKTAAALETLRRAQVDMGDGMTAIAEHLSRAIGKVFRGLEGVFARIVVPVWTYLKRIADRLTKVIDRVLKNWNTAIDNIRRRVLAIYDKYFRPVLDVIQKIRRITAALRILGVKWAGRLDARLLKLEGKIISPILAVLKRLDEHSEFLNVLLTARGYLQTPVLLASVWRSITDVLDMWWYAHTGDPAEARAEELRRKGRPLTPAAARTGLVDYLEDRTGVLAPSMTGANRVWAQKPANPVW